MDYSLLSGLESTLEGSRFDFGSHKNISISLLGLYQPRNAASVLSAIDILRKCGLDIPEDAVKCGLSLARWAGRFEVISKDPLIIFDGAHNAQGIDSAVRSVKHYFKDRKVYILTGVLKDKDYQTIASRLSEIGSRAFVMTPDSPRALPSEEYAEVLGSYGVDATAFGSIKDAFSVAREAAQKDGVPLVCLGSLYVYVDLIDLV